MKNSLFLILAILFPVVIQAQDIQLFEPLNYQNAVKNGTRNHDGTPGPNYWQNHSDYDISVKFDTTSHKIFGEETVLYHNESPDTLKQIVIRLYPNREQKGAIRNRPADPADLHDGVVLDSIIINNNLVELNEKNSTTNGTNLMITLAEPLPPNQSLSMSCKWNYPVPVETKDRIGYYKDEAWFIGYFYPQIAVYDDLEIYGSRTGLIKGWDYTLFHMGIQQFYNDFNNYKVSIEVPVGFYVWGTGSLVNEKEVYPAEILKRLNEARSSDSIVRILKPGDSRKYIPGNIWKFEANHVSDFAFGTSPSYCWDGTSVKLAGKRVFTDAAYDPDSKMYDLVAGMVKETVKYASEVYPGIEFPYEHATVFNGKKSGGMEFPMIANNSEGRDTTNLFGLTFHEVFHNYTPFMMGFNEKRYGFMDEGMTSYYTAYFESHFLNKPATGRSTPAATYGMMAPYADAPLIYSTLMENRFNGGLLDYLKPQMVYGLFEQMVGDENFKKAMQLFVERWQGKHPTPWDFFYTVNDALNENYNWFWKAWFFDFAYPDLGLKLNGKTLTVERVGVDALPVPVNLIVTYKDGTTDHISKSMKVWKDGAKAITINLKDVDKIESIGIDEATVPDVNKENNLVSIN